MLNPSFHQVYLVNFYNKVVRALVKDNQSHTFFEDHWADVHTQDVDANSEDEARAKLAKRFPPEDGFVIAKRDASASLGPAKRRVTVRRRIQRRATHQRPSKAPRQSPNQSHQKGMNWYRPR